MQQFSIKKGKGESIFRLCRYCVCL